MQGLLRVLAVLIGVWLLASSPPLQPLTAHALSGAPVVADLLHAGAGLWDWVLNFDFAAGGTP